MGQSLRLDLLIALGAAVTGVAFMLRYWLVGCVLIAMLIIAVFAWAFPFLVGRCLLGILALRFPSPKVLPDDVAGIMVLAGSVSRLMTFRDLINEYPNATRVFVGGAGPTVLERPHLRIEAERVLDELGIPGSTVIFESSSRNTHENAMASRKLLENEYGGTWILITCPWHLPRAIGCFRKVGWHVIAYPAVTEQRDLGKMPYRQGREILHRALKEWLALVAYRLMGYTSQLFPRAEPLS